LHDESGDGEGGQGGVGDALPAQSPAGAGIAVPRTIADTMSRNVAVGAVAKKAGQ
jgi:hypothetical protein